MYFSLVSDQVSALRITIANYVIRNVCNFVPMLNFTDSADASRSSADERQDAERCDVTYGDVIDKAARKNISICRRAEQDGSGLSRVYVSQSNSLHIVFTPAASQQQRNFIIHLQGKQV